MKKVLIALDYDPTAQKVAEEGYAIAKAMGAEVILLHVIADPEYYSLTQYLPAMGITGYLNINPVSMDIIDSLKTTSQYFLDKSKEHLGDESIQTVVKEGGFAEAILEAAKELHADIIIMGSHSRKWLEDIIMGSVTEKVLHHTSIPLLIIPFRKA